MFNAENQTVKTGLFAETRKQDGRYSRFAPGDGSEAGRDARGPHVRMGIKSGLRMQQGEKEPDVSKQAISLLC